VLILGIQIACLVLWAKSPITRVAIAAATMQVLCGLQLILLTVVDHTRSIRPSSALSIYLLAIIVLNAVQIRTLFLRQYLIPVAGLLSTDIILKVILLILESLPRKFIDQKTHPYSPEALAGVLSRSIFWWLNRILLQGYRSLLKPADLPYLDRNLQSRPLQKGIRNKWNTSKLVFSPPSLST
jgi:ATP-binding cassette subfamily C (CFTR/MRP) protein 1